MNSNQNATILAQEVQALRQRLDTFAEEVAQPEPLTSGRVRITSTVPVYIVVNTDTNKVEEVVVDDEVNPVHHMAHIASLVDDDNTDVGLAGTHQRRMAREILSDGSVSWPLWQFGW